MEGVRAPQIGAPYAQPAQPVSVGRAAAAMAAAAVIGAAGGSAAVDAGYNVQTGQRQFTPPTRYAAPATPNNLSPFFNGQTGSKAPTLTNPMPSARVTSPMDAASAPPRIGGGGGGGIGQLATGVAALGIGNLIKGGIPGLPKIDPKFINPLNNGTRLPADFGQRPGSLAKKLNDAIGNLNPFKNNDRTKNQRKGDKNPGLKPDEPLSIGKDPYATYLVTIDVKYASGGGNQLQYIVQGSVPGIAKTTNGESATWTFQRTANVNVTIASGPTNQFSGNPTISNIQRLSAGNDPIPEPLKFGDPNVGLTLIPPVGTTSPVPNIPNNSPSPTNTNRPPNGSPLTSPQERGSNLPSAPSQGEPTKPGGENSPFVPIPTLPSVNPSTNGQTSSPTSNATLSPLPGMPNTGSASFGSWTVPSPYNQQQGTRNEAPISPPKPEAPTEKPADAQPDSCCTKTQENLADIRKVLGVGEFPAQLPILTGDSTKVINNIPELMLWQTTNLDAVGGLFPINVKVLQPDGTEKSIKLENMSHAMEELFLMNLTMAEDCDAAVNIGARLATEIVQTKILVHQVGDIVKSIQKFFGFAVAAVPRIIKLNFSPAAAGADNTLQNDEMKAFLKPSSKTYLGTDLVEKKEGLPMLERILLNSEIARAAVWHPLKPGGKTEDNITGTKLNDRRTKPTKAEKLAWDKLIKDLKDRGIDVTDKSKASEVTK